jgi:hypothetical protein
MKMSNIIADDANYESTSFWKLPTVAIVYRHLVLNGVSSFVNIA